MANHNKKFGLFIVAFILFSVYCFVLSDSGMLKRMMLTKQISHIQTQILYKQSEIHTYKELMKGNNISMLLLRESIKAGYIPKGAKAFEFQNNKDIRREYIPSTKDDFSKFEQYVYYGRILWATFSVLIIVGLLLYYRNKNPI